MALAYAKDMYAVLCSAIEAGPSQAKGCVRMTVCWRVCVCVTVNCMAIA